MLTKDFHKDKLHVRAYDSRLQMGRQAALEAASRMRELLKTQDFINVMFAAAPSQNEMLQCLVDEDLDWSRINAFHMDEYVGLSEQHPASFRNFLNRAIFSRRPFRSVNLLNGNDPDPENECARYSQLLKDNRLDICLLGVGENGHIAFNDPPIADFNDPKVVKVALLEQTCRLQQVHDLCFPSLDQVPSHALTVTIPALCQARSMFCVVPAKTKAHAVQLMLEGPIATSCPASILRLQEDARLYLDQDSSASLR